MKSALFLAPLALILTYLPVQAVDTCGPFLEKSHALTDLYFSEHSEGIEEHTLREGNLATHLYMDYTNANSPYLFAGFPAGNSGVGIWFNSDQDIKLRLSEKPIGIPGKTPGVSADVQTNVQKLEIVDALLGSMRFIRDRELGKDVLMQSLGEHSERITRNDVEFQDGKLILTRESLNGKAAYRAEITPIDGTRIRQVDGQFELVSTTTVHFRFKAFSSEKPLTPLAMEDFFNEDVLDRLDPKRLKAFSFLAYKEKLLAGAPRYFSKFGRDSIYTLRVLMDYMKPNAIENILSSILASMDPSTGSISHEQHEGDFASFERLRNRQPYKKVEDYIEDRKMIDDDFAAALVVARYFNLYPEKSKAFLDKESQGIQQKHLVEKLFESVIDKAMPLFNAAAAGKTGLELVPFLISLHEGEPTGQWRDSNNGLAGGRYPFDVNAAFVPGALYQLINLYGWADSRNLFYDPDKADSLSAVFDRWNTLVPKLFEISVTPQEAAARVKDYTSDLSEAENFSTNLPDENIVFPAIALDSQGTPIPVMHSDDSLMLTFGQPSESYLRQMAKRLRLRFPYGLQTPIGLLVANPAYADKSIRTKFGKQHYHGRVVWTMQEDLMLFGLQRQYDENTAINESTRLELKKLRSQIDQLIKSRTDLGGIEVFSIESRNGVLKPKPFAGDAKSNSNQLWGHLRLILDF